MTQAGFGLGRARRVAWLAAFAALLGQAHAFELPFQADGAGYTRVGGACLWRAEGPLLARACPEGDGVVFSLVGADPAVHPAPEGTPARLNRAVGDAAQWQAGVPLFPTLRWAQAWPGVDLVARAHPAGLERDFVVAPGGDPNQIRFQIDGLDGQPWVDAQGRMRRPGPDGAVLESAPQAWQGEGPDRVPVAAGFAQRADGAWGFAVGPYDPARPLIIDPVVGDEALPSLPRGGFLGATTAPDSAQAVVVGPDGTRYVTGYGVAPEGQRQGGDDVFVLALAPDGSLRWITWLGGTRDYLLEPTCTERVEATNACRTWQAHPRGLGGNDIATALALEGDWLAVAGHTYSVDFPNLAGVQAQPALGPEPTQLGRRAQFFAGLRAGTGALAVSTLIDAPGDEVVDSVALRGPLVRILASSRAVVQANQGVHLSDANGTPAGSAFAQLTALRWENRDAAQGGRLVLQAPSTYTGAQAAYGNALVWPPAAAEPLWFTGGDASRLIDGQRVYPLSGGPANVMDAVWLGRTAAGLDRLAVTGNARGVVGGFDGQVCDDAPAAPCANCSFTFLIWLEGRHCVRGRWFGRSDSELVFDLDHRTLGPDEDWLLLGGRITSPAMPTPAGAQKRPSPDLPAGVDAFYRLVDARTGALRIASYLGRQRPLFEGGFQSDDVITGVALSPDGYAVLVGGTWSGLIDFAQPNGLQDPTRFADSGQAFVAEAATRVTDVSLTMAAPNPAARDGVAALEVNVHVEGTRPAEGLTVDLVARPGVEWLNLAAQGCQAQAGRVVCTHPQPLALGQTWQLVLQARQPAGRGPTEVTVTGVASARGDDPDLNDNLATAKLLFGASKVALAFVPAADGQPHQVAPDQPITVPLNITHTGEPVAVDLHLTVAQGALEAPPAGCRLEDDGRRMVCPMPLPQAAPAPLVVTVRVPAAALPQGVVERHVPLRAEARPQAGAALALTQPAATSLWVRYPDASVPRPADPPTDTADFGGTVELQVVVRNAGPGPVTNAQVQVLLNTFTFVDSASGCAPQPNNALLCSRAEPLAAGAEATFRFRATAPQRRPGQAPHVVPMPATLNTTEIDRDTHNNFGELRVRVGGHALSVTRDDRGAATWLDAPLAYELRNDSNEPAPGVVVEHAFDLPTGLRVRDAQAAGSPCDIQTLLTTRDARGAEAPARVLVRCVMGLVAGNVRVPISMVIQPLGKGPIAEGVHLEAEGDSRTTLGWVSGSRDVAVPDLQVTALQVPAELVRGEPARATVSLRNAGQGATAGVQTLKFTFSPPLAAAPTLGGSACATNRIVGTVWEALCDVAVAPGAAANYDLDFVPNSAGALALSATFHDPAEEEASLSREIRLTQVRGADLAGSLAADATVAVGEALPFALTLRNAGPAATAGLEATFQFDPVHLTVGALPAGCRQDPGPGQIRCSLSIRAQSEATTNVPFTAAKPTAATAIQATVTERDDPRAATLVAPHTVAITGPDLELQALAPQPDRVVSEGAQVRWEARITNLSERHAGSVVLELTGREAEAAADCDDPVTGLALTVNGVPCPLSGNSPTAVSASLATCAEQPIAPRETLSAVLVGVAACPGKLGVGFTAWPGAAHKPDARFDNNRGSATVQVVPAALEISFTPPAVDAPWQDTPPHTLRIRGPAGAAVDQGAVVTLTQGAGTDLALDTPAGHPLQGACQAQPGGLRCTLPAIPAGPDGLSVPVDLSRSAPPLWGQVAVTAVGTPPRGQPGSPVRLAGRVKGPELRYQQIAGPAGPARVGDRVEWRLAVLNPGPGDSVRPAIEFVIPRERFEAVTLDGATHCYATNDGRLCTLDASNLRAGEQVEVVLGARVRRPGAAQITARTRELAGADEDPSNDEGFLAVQVDGPDLAASLGVQPAVAQVGGAVAVTLTVRNQGRQDGPPTTATVAVGGLVAGGPLPAGCILAAGQAQCAVPALPVGQASQFVLPLQAGAPGTVTLTATVDSPDDEDPSNNTDRAEVQVLGGDSDGDGVPDADEDAGPNDGDANHDGVADRTQPHVASLPVPQYGALVLIAPAGATVRSFGLVAPPAPPPAGVRFPLGVLSYEVAGVAPGSVVPLQLVLPAGVPAWAFWKYANGWVELTWDGTTGARAVAPDTLELRVRDGGRGDEDGQADGVIRDPGAPALLELAVNDVGDAPDAAPGDGACATAAGRCTLRAAIQEANAAGRPQGVRFSVPAQSRVTLTAPLPTLAVPLVLDARAVAGAYAGEPGVWLQVGYGEGDPVVRVEAPGCALEGLAIADARGDGVQVAAPKFRFAHGWIGRPRYGFGSRDERTGLRTDGAPGAAAGLTMVASWVGLAHGSSGYGVVASGPDLRFEDVTLNLSPRDGLRPQGDLLNGILLRDAPHARVIGLHEIYTQQGLVFEGDCTGARVTGSTFGLGADGLCHAFQRDDPGPAEEGPGACLDHGGLGLVVRGARGVQIGGPLPEDRNVFGDFDQDAIWVTGDSEGTLIQGNWLGLAADGTCQPSGPEGLCRLQQQSVLRVSGGVGTQILDNHTGPSPIVVDGTARDTELRGNQLGVFADDLRVTWTVFTSRYRTALRVQPGTAGTVVAGNRMSGAELAGPTAFFENRVGLDAAGAAMPEDGPALQAYPLGARGWARGLRLLDGSAGSVVHDNAIAHFADWCVAVEAADDVVFRDNQVGLSADGAQVTRCLGGGLRLWRSDRVAVTGNGFAACGAVPNARFEVACVLVGRDSEDARVADNRFGLTTAGEVAASPNPAVVLERALRPQIVGNTILGASPWGIYDRGDFFGVPPAEAARITANRVGVDPDGVIRGGAPQAGILAVGSGARIGGVDPDEGNWIAGAGGPGVWVGNVTGVQVRGNRLEANGGLGISLGGGSDPAANDPLDGDGGPNGYQNHPTLHGGLGARAVTARLASHPNQDFTVDVYAVAQPDPSGHGEADEWLGAAVVRTDAQGAGETVVALSRDVLPAEQVTAVATGAEGSSEFGPAVALGAQPEARLLAALNGPLPADVGQPADVGLYVENSGPQAAPAAVYTVTVPEGITWRTLPEPPFGDCVDEGRVLRCTLGELGPGVVWEAQAQLQGDAPGVYPVTARIESGARNLTPANGEQTQELVVGGVGFLLVARAQNFQNRFDVGQPAPLEAQIFRTGAPATVIRDLTLFVTLPVAGTLDAPCVPDGARWRCPMGDVAARQSPTYVLTARFAQPTPAGGPAQVEVLAEAANPNFEGVQRGVVFLTVVGEPLPEGLRLTLAANGPAGPAGAPTPVRLTVQNLGGPVTGAAVRATLPPGTTLGGALPCLNTGDEALCPLPDLAAGAQLTFDLTLTTPDEPGRLTACAERPEHAPEGCAELPVTPAPLALNVALEAPQPPQSPGEVLALIARVTAPTGTPPGTLRLAGLPEPAPGVGPEAGGCDATPAGLRCAVPALAAGQVFEVPVAWLPLAPQAARVTATAEVGGVDRGQAQATVLVSAAADCPAGAPRALWDGAAPALSAFAPAAEPAATTAYTLGAAAGHVTSPALAAATGTLRVAALSRRDLPPEAEAVLELSSDGGLTWPVQHPLPPALDAEEVLSLAAPEGPFQIRWRVADAAAGAWTLDGLQVVACEPRGRADVAVVASQPLVEVAADAPALAELQVRHRGGDPLVGAWLALTLSEPQAATLSAPGCAPHGTGLRCPLPVMGPAEDWAVAITGTRDDTAPALLTLTAQLGGLTGVADPQAARAQVRWRFGDAPLPATTALAWDPDPAVGLPLPHQGEGVATLTVAGDPLAEHPGGTLTLRAGPALTLAAPGCEAAGDGLRCPVAPFGAGEAVALPVTVTAGAVDGPAQVVAAWASANAEALPVPEATLPVQVGEGAVRLSFPADVGAPPAQEVTAVALRVQTAAPVGPVTVALGGDPGLTLRAVAGDGATCGAFGNAFRCEFSHLEQDAALNVEVLPEDAGSMRLWAEVVAGPAGDPSTAALRWQAARDCDAHPCPAGGPCDDVTCDPALGCQTAPLDAVPCDPGLGCDVGGVCAQGACLPDGLACGAGAGDPCSAHLCGPDGACVAVPLDGRPCGGDACHQAGACADGACVPGAPVDCADEDPCTDDACDPDRGCVNPRRDTPECACDPEAVQAACEGDVFVRRDGCGDVLELTPCDDEDPCTADLCDGAAGCLHDPLDAPGCPECVPACEPGACGLDPRCGVECGACPAGQACFEGACIADPCLDLPPAGCCEPGAALSCDQGPAAWIDCGDDGCGYDAAQQAFVCGGQDPAPEGDGRCPWVPACEVDGDCADDDDCTVDTCLDGACVHERLDGPECAPDAGVDLGVDLGPPDDGPLDLGPPDDADLPDADRPDADRPDADRPDILPLDAGRPSDGGRPILDGAPPVGTDGAPDPGVVEDGCDCDAGGGPAPTGLLPWALLLLGLRRRRYRQAPMRTKGAQ